MCNPGTNVSVERFAVQRRARRTNGSLMLLRFPCGGIVRCNGLLDGHRHTPALEIWSQREKSALFDVVLDAPSNGPTIAHPGKHLGRVPYG